MPSFIQTRLTESEASYDYVEKVSALDSPVITDNASQNDQEDIAIVGMACRLPGGNHSPEQLWESLMAKKIASGTLPKSRWEAYYHRDPRNPKVLNDTTQRGYFLDDMESFDSSFFGVSPKEAVLMDPQQRLSLEVTWEALEDAGIPPQSLAGTNTACYIGVNSDDYGKLLLEDIPGVEAWMGIGTAYCGIPNRISYLLDLRGPSTAVDAACASSLVAIHHGRQSLLTRETNLAIVGGVNVLCGPGLTRVLDKAGAISKDGTCRSFDNDADGYGRGEGSGIVILKRLSDAERDNDNILAVLKGSAVGQDGRTNGIMAPNGLAQEAVARRALGSIDPLSIQYIEAHATSTSVGDPVEVNAMSAIYGKGRQENSPCYVGSIKPNVGHLEAGAGVVGFIKAVMALRAGTVPPQANLVTLNKKIDWATAGIKVPFKATDWPEVKGQRRAAICSYGYGGTVSHAVIEEAPKRAQSSPQTALEMPSVLLLSAPHEKRISTFANFLGKWMTEKGEPVPLSSLACTLATRRGYHDFRAAAVVEDRAEAMKLLQNFNDSKVVTSRVMSEEAARVVWMFSGHGAQWPSMGQELLKKEPVFVTIIEELDHVIQAEADFSAIQALREADFDTTDKIQILTYVVQVGLAVLLQIKGARPSAIVGHSVGEVAASVVSGALTPAEGATVICRRAVLYREVMGQGAMALIQIPFTEVSTMLQARRDIWPAIDSSPSSCVVAGSVLAVQEFSTVCNDQGIKVLKVNTDVAFHTPLLGPLAKRLLNALDAIKPAAPFIPLYSTATEDPREQAPRDAMYWVQNMLKPVQLTSAIRCAVKDGYRIFLEVSTHPIIAHSVSETIMDMDVDEFMVSPTLLRNKSATRSIMKSLVTMWVKGAPIDWSLFFGNVEWAKTIPKTQWQHRAFWKMVDTGAVQGGTTHDVDAHNLLGQCIPIADEKKTVFTTKLDNNTKPFPGSHPLHGTEIIPAAVLFNTFFGATGCHSLANVNLRVPVAISAPRDVQVLVEGNSVRLMSHLIPDGGNVDSDQNLSWLTHTTATTMEHQSDSTPRYGQDIDIASVRSRIGTELKPSFSQEYLAGVGVPDMGFPWDVTDHVGNSKEMLARVDVCPSVSEGQAVPWNLESWAPVFDAATSIGSTLFYEDPCLRMPAYVSNISIRDGSVPPKIAYIYVTASETTESDLASDVTITDDTGKALAKFNNMRFSQIEGSPRESHNVGDLVHQLSWLPARLSETPSSLHRVLLLGSDGDGLTRAYQQALCQRQITCTLLPVGKFLAGDYIRNDEEGTVVLYVPGESDSSEEIPDGANRFCQELLAITKHIATQARKARIYATTHGALTGDTDVSMAQAPLVGLSRIIASEHPDIWGALIEVESVDFPFQVVKYVTGADVVKMEDSIAKVARLQPFPKLGSSSISHLDPRPEGTYVISGGLGSLGLEVAAHLTERGARRIVLLSRRALPPRKTWSSAPSPWQDTIRKVQNLEKVGATIYSVPIDLSNPNASQDLATALESLDTPPVLGVVHCAGVLEDQLVLSTTPAAFARVLAPKVVGALNLDATFPAATLDFFVLFSSCGQLFGFPGQASYASGNAFLDTLAERRRRLGDNAVAFQWTSWRGVGGMGDNEFVEAELEGRGFTSVTRAEAFEAWDEVSRHDVSQAVVLRSRLLDADEDIPCAILEKIAKRRAPMASTTTTTADASSNSTTAKSAKDLGDMPQPGAERVAFLTTKIAECVAQVLQLADVGEVDPKAALSDMGMDSVMTVAFRKELQKALKVKVPPTLVWGHPTVGHLVKWVDEQIRG
ncbi:polyketide syntase 2 [Lepidopterella palustris CBS 459.81]|uniref:6-methylsalicylic acid synthase n=1 Tax=Lepidopterella palustris CBS 459.81 TaxID=1314670 RepID=A0A8E2EFF5_9PEZI|nr:polyketide syntase 2 [Lepidopterella palustris CBS 459.81]